MTDMEKTTKWEKHRIGKLYGHTVFIELPSGLSGQQEVDEIDRASRFLEESFRNADFIADWRDFMNRLT